MVARNDAADADELPRAVARARYVRMTPMKVRRVVDLVRGRGAQEALAVLQFAPQAASRPVSKLIASAMANAENNLALDPETLVISRIYVDEGPTLKRFQPRAQGRAYRINKRTSHITVEVESHPERKESRGRGRQRGAKRASGVAQKGRAR